MHRNSAYALAIATLFGLLSCRNNTEPQIYNDFFVSKDTIDVFLKTKMEEMKIPGLSIAIINDGKVWYHRSMGYANLEKKIPVTEKTIFEGASMSKSVFACFVMTYVE